MAIGSNRKAVKTWLKALRRKQRLPVIWLAAFSLFPETVLAQTTARITTQIDNSERATIPGTHSPLATPANDGGQCRRELSSAASAWFFAVPLFKKQVCRC
jgi:hypothetical protein